MKFYFNLEGEYLNSSQLAYENGYIEGNLNIYINEALFFSETHANVLELAIQLAKWLQKVENGDVCDLVYDTLNSDDSPLQFYVCEQGIHVHSPYEQQPFEPLPIEMVKHAVLNYCIDLQIALLRIDYEQRLDDLLKKLVSVNK